jgi:hypothetical protein
MIPVLVEVDWILVLLVVKYLDFSSFSCEIFVNIFESIYLDIFKLQKARDFQIFADSVLYRETFSSIY